MTLWGLRYKADVLGSKTLAYGAEQTSGNEEIVLGRFEDKIMYLELIQNKKNLILYACE